MTLSQRLRELAERLAPVSDAPRADAEWLAAHALGLPRSALLTRGDESPAWPEAAEALVRRREQGEPLAYVLGSQEFWSLDLHVQADVLVPRADTETLVEAVLEALRELRSPQVLDLGTGSGCIALAIAHERGDARVMATDRSESALDVARGNARRLRLDSVQFQAGDWFGALAGATPSRFDVIASNPPYVAAGDPHLPALRHEPQSALVSGEDGLDDLRRIVKEAPAWLKSGGHLLVEHGCTQGPAVRALFASAGFSAVRTRQDLGGNERVTQGRAA